MFFSDFDNKSKWFKGGIFENRADCLDYDFAFILGGEEPFSANLYNLSQNSITFSILSLGCPKIDAKDLDVQSVIDKINKAGGIAVISSPSQNLNSPEEIAGFNGLFGLEIISPLFDNGEYSRGYSGGIVDAALCRNRNLFLTAGVNSSDMNTFFMVRAKTNSAEDILDALRKGHFYITSGPEIINISAVGNEILLECSPCVKAAFLSSSVWAPKRLKLSNNETDFKYTHMSFEDYIRIEITDKNDNKAYSQPIFLKEEQNV